MSSGGDCRSSIVETIGPVGGPKTQKKGASRPRDWICLEMKT